MCVKFGLPQVGLFTFERKILLKTHGPMRDLNEEFKIKKNADLEKLYNKLNIGKYLKAKQHKWVGHVW